MANREHTVKLPMPDQVVGGKYRLVARAGNGGMGLVFLGEELGTGRRVALKFLDPEPTEDESRLARFLREGKVGFAVQHPGAATLLDFGRDDSMRLFLCFEYVEGEDLRELLRREGRLPWAEARDIARQVAEVLAFAHARHVVHRDIKPENLRVRRDAQGTHVKVLDFGIARLLDDTGVRLTGEGMLAGTPRYMAPEQVNDAPLDGRIDQYSLGLVFFEMLTGALAMPGRNITQILMHQLQTTVPPLSAVDPALDSPEVDAFLARACAKDREARFPTMADFTTALLALRVDESRWPSARTPQSEVASSDGLTRDLKPPKVSSGLADTYLRPQEPTLPATPAQRTEDGRREVPTEPERFAVARKPAAPAEAAPLSPAYPGDEVSQRTPARARPEPEARVAPLPPEVVTEPERAAVARREPPRAPGLDTVLGAPLPPPPKPPPSKRGLALGVLLGAAAVGFALVWWLTHRG